MIQIYNIENTNFDQNGDMSLFPSSASVHAVLNGIWEVTLEHPKDSEDRWKYIKEGAVVKMPSFNGEQLFRITYKEKVIQEYLLICSLYLWMRQMIVSFWMSVQLTKQGSRLLIS